MSVDQDPKKIYVLPHQIWVLIVKIVLPIFLIFVNRQYYTFQVIKNKNNCQKNFLIYFIKESPDAIESKSYKNNYALLKASNSQNKSASNVNRVLSANFISAKKSRVLDAGKGS